MRSRFRSWWTKWLLPTWHLVPFSPLLYLFVLGASSRVLTSTYPPIPFENIGSSQLIYYLWCVLGIVGPILALVGYYFITHSKGKYTYLGLWFMFGADVAILFWLLSFHIAVVLDDSRPMTDQRVVGRYMIASIMLFIVLLIARDLKALVRVERISKKVRNGHG